MKNLLKALLIIPSLALAAPLPTPSLQWSPPSSYVERVVPMQICIQNDESGCFKIQYFFEEWGFVVAEVIINGEIFLGWPRPCMYDVCRMMLMNTAKDLHQQVKSRYPNARFGSYGTI